VKIAPGHRTLYPALPVPCSRSFSDQ